MRLVYVLTFLSGFAALVYQILWIRELSLILGSSTAAISTVVAAFMAGLALGSAVAGRWADRVRRRIVLYAWLEAGIGASAIAVMALLPAIGSVYRAMAASSASGSGVPAVVRFLMVFALLLAPTFLMGGTFPVLVRLMTGEVRRLGGTVGLLYGANTAGAVAGAFTTGIFLIGAIGIPATYGIAVATNFAVGLAAWAMPLLGMIGRKPSNAGAAAFPSGATAATSSRGTGDSRLRTTFVVAVALSGCIALGYEIVWSRALAIVLGHSIYAFTFVLATYLTGISLGGYLAAPLLDRLNRPAQVFATGLLVLAVSSGVSLLFLPVLPFQEYLAGMPPLPYILKNLLCTVAVMIVPTVLMGGLLPLGIRVYTSDLEHAGRASGTLYAWNTLGAIAGSLVSGFVLIPSLGVQTSFYLLVAGNVALALFVGFRVGWLPAWKAAAAVITLVAVAGVFASRGSPILRNKAVSRVESVLGKTVDLLYYAEDEVAAVGLVQEPGGPKRLFTNGTMMTHLGHETAYMAHLPIAMVENPKEVLVLCLGMGNTYAAARRHPARVTAVELSPEVVESFHLVHAEITGAPGAATSDGSRPPRGPARAGDRILVDDARHIVAIADRKFDVITIDPPPPLYSAGTVNFHTREFYELCLERITPRGVVCMWIPFGNCSVEEFRILMRTYYSVFDRMMVWIPPPALGVAGVYMIGLGPEAVLDLPAIKANLVKDAVTGGMAQFLPGPPSEFLPIPVLSRADVEAFTDGALVMDDAHPWLEYPLFRNAGRVEPMTWMHINDFLVARRTSPN